MRVARKDAEENPLCVAIERFLGNFAFVQGAAVCEKEVAVYGKKVQKGIRHAWRERGSWIWISRECL